MFMRTRILACEITLLATLIFISKGSNVQKRQATRDLCKNKSDGFHRHPKSCDLYLWCLLENGFIMHCPYGTHFDKVTKSCTWPFIANCERRTFENSLYGSLADRGTSQDEDSNISNTDEKNSKDEDVSKNVNNGKCTRIVCYFTNWAQYRPGIGMQLPEDIDASLCTHIIHSFAHITNNMLDTFEYNDDDLIRRLMIHKRYYRGLKTLVAVGGWNMKSGPFTKMVETTTTRKTFIDSAIKFLRKYDFEGLDLDWEYPTKRGGVPEDKVRLTYLVEELRIAFDNEAIPPGKSKLLLTAAVAAGKKTIDESYEVDKLNNHLDFINLMSYDLHGPWDNITGHNSPLLEVKEAAEYWVEKGASRHKLVIGMALYGRTFTLLDKNFNGYGAPGPTAGVKGKYTGEAGMLAYYEICDILKKPETSKHLHDGTDPYCVYGDQWICYDDEDSLRKKVDFIITEDFGGAMVWQLGEDDFRGESCGKGKYPLMKAIKESCKLT